MSAIKNNYKLIEFIGERKEEKGVDLVPSGWISYDKESGYLLTLFMPPPYTAVNSKVLHNMVKHRLMPDENWPKFPIEIKGEAGKSLWYFLFIILRFKSMGTRKIMFLIHITYFLNTFQ